MPKSAAAPFVSSIFNALLETATDGPSDAIKFELTDKAIEGFGNTMMFELNRLGFESSLLRAPDSLPPFSIVDPIAALSNHVAVGGDNKSSEGKKEYRLFYGRLLLSPGCT